MAATVKDIKWTNSSAYVSLLLLNVSAATFGNELDQLITAFATTAHLSPSQVSVISFMNSSSRRRTGTTGTEVSLLIAPAVVTTSPSTTPPLNPGLTNGGGTTILGGTNGGGITISGGKINGGATTIGSGTINGTGPVLPGGSSNTGSVIGAAVGGSLGGLAVLIIGFLAYRHMQCNKQPPVMPPVIGATSGGIVRQEQNVEGAATPVSGATSGGIVRPEHNVEVLDFNRSLKTRTCCSI